MPLTQLNLGSELGVEILHHRWYALVLYQLTEDPTEFMDLRQSIRGISTFNLFTTLHKLEDWGLVDAFEDDDYHYQLTSNGAMFHRILHDFESWGNHELTNNLAI